MRKLLPVLLLFLLPLGLSAQNNEQFYSDLSRAWQAGNVKSLSVMLDDQVDFSREGKEGRFSRRQLEGELNHLFSASRPRNFTLKHKGSSQDGQIYLIGQLETHSGSRYKIVCRARPVHTAYRIIRLDVDKGE